jgi:hypothetical protein
MDPKTLRKRVALLSIVAALISGPAPVPEVAPTGTVVCAAGGCCGEWGSACIDDFGTYHEHAYYCI